MFHRREETLPPDPQFPADLEKLGYFIDEEDRIRSLENPRWGFHYWISKNERVLEVHREAMNTCIRDTLAPRFGALGLQVTRLPVTAGPLDPHVPVLTSTNLETASRIAVFAGGVQQDLGVLSYRVMGKASLSEGSLLEFVRAAMTADPDTAIVAANVGQLVWYRRGRRAMSTATWSALPRATGVDGPKRKDPIHNSVEGHRSTEEHTASVMAFIQDKIGRRNVAIDVIGVEEGGELLPRYLDENWDAWKNHVRAICIGLGFVWQTEYDFGNEEFRTFWSKRARMYLLNTLPVGTPLATNRAEAGCNCYSAGEPHYAECIMTNAHRAFLEYFDLVQRLPGYEEIDLDENVDQEKGRNEDSG